METITAPASTQPPTPASENPPVRETIEGPAGTLFDEVKRVIEEGTARRIVVKQGDQVVVEFPLVVGVVGTVLAAPLAALGALIALLGDCTIEVERDEPSTEAEPVSEEARHAEPVGCQLGHDLPGQMGLADARLAGEEDHPVGARRGGSCPFHQVTALALPDLAHGRTSVGCPAAEL
jgi:hypothetical protein